MNKLWYLSQIKIFEALEEKDLIEMGRISHMSSISKNTLIQTPQTFREGLYLLKKGKLRLYKTNMDGKQFTLGILGAGNVFGETDSFSLGTSDVYIETLENTIICSLTKTEFEQFLVKRPEVSLKLLQVMSERLKEQNAMLEKLALSDVKERVTYLLTKFSEQFGIVQGDYSIIDLPLTHQELANMIGATRESVTNTLNILVKEGVIKTERKSISLRRNK